MYTVRVTTQFRNVVELSTSDTFLSLDGLRTFTTYFCTISASNSVGQGPYSDPVSIATPEDGKDE